MPAGNSTAPSTLPKTKLLFLRKTPEVALKQADIIPCSRLQLWNDLFSVEKLVIPLSVLIIICPSISGRIV